MRDSNVAFIDRPRWQTSPDVRDALNEAVDIANVLHLVLGGSDRDLEPEDIKSIETVAYGLYSRLHRLARDCEKESGGVHA